MRLVDFAGNNKLLISISVIMMLFAVGGFLMMDAFVQIDPRIIFIIIVVMFATLVYAIGKDRW